MDMRCIIPTIFLLSSIVYSETLHAAVQDDASMTYCIILDSEVSGTANYFNTFKNATIAYDFLVNGTSVNISGKCHKIVANQTVEKVDIHFIPNDLNISSIEAQHLWTIKLEFSDMAKDQTFKIINYELEAYFYKELNASTKPSEKVLYSMANGTELEWGAAANHGYSCCSKSTLDLTNSSSIQFASLKVIAFAKEENSTFTENDSFEICKSDM